jgi:hypothetical protein
MTTTTGPDNLRTRIAEALYGQILHPVPLFDDQPDEVQAAWLADADAVIEALGLRKQSDKLVRRYTTDWEADV